MEKLIRRIANIALLVVAGIAVFAVLYAIVKGDKFAETSQSLDISLYIMYALLVVVLAILTFFVVVQTISSKKTMIQSLVILGVGGIIILFSYLISSSELSDIAMKMEVSEAAYRWTGAGLIMMYILFVGVILAFIGSLLYTKFKK
jgi:TRAP-type C4-dicarboxylate transport system permease small subunit